MNNGDDSDMNIREWTNYDFSQIIGANRGGGDTLYKSQPSMNQMNYEDNNENESFHKRVDSFKERHVVVIRENHEDNQAEIEPAIQKKLKPNPSPNKPKTNRELHEEKCVFDGVRRPSGEVSYNSYNDGVKGQRLSIQQYCQARFLDEKEKHKCNKMSEFFRRNEFGIDSAENWGFQRLDEDRKYDWVIEDILVQSHYSANNSTGSRSQILGKGAFGSVIKAKDNNTQAQYALKFIKKSFYSKAITETEIMKLFRNNDHIIQYHDIYLYDQQTQRGQVIEIQQYLVIVMELASASLEDVLKLRVSCQAHWTCTELLSIFRHLTQSVESLASKRIAHRDIKPSNILYCLQSKSYKLADFGEAKRVESVSFEEPHSPRGTKKYMSPELLNGLMRSKKDRPATIVFDSMGQEQVSNKILYEPYSNDIYSLGIVFFQIKFLDDLSAYTGIEEKSPLTEDYFLEKLKGNDQTDKLIRSMLSINPQERPSIQQVLEFIDSETKIKRSQSLLPVQQLSYSIQLAPKVAQSNAAVPTASFATSTIAVPGSQPISNEIQVGITLAQSSSSIQFNQNTLNFVAENDNLMSEKNEVILAANPIERFTQAAVNRQNRLKENQNSFEIKSEVSQSGIRSASRKERENSNGSIQSEKAQQQQQQQRSYQQLTVEERNYQYNNNSINNQSFRLEDQNNIIVQFPNSNFQNGTSMRSSNSRDSFKAAGGNTGGNTGGGGVSPKRLSSSNSQPAPLIAIASSEQPCRSAVTYNIPHTEHSNSSSSEKIRSASIYQRSFAEVQQCNNSMMVSVQQSQQSRSIQYDRMPAMIQQTDEMAMNKPLRITACCNGTFDNVRTSKVIIGDSRTIIKKKQSSSIRSSEEIEEDDEDFSKKSEEEEEEDDDEDEDDNEYVDESDNQSGGYDHRIDVEEDEEEEGVVKKDLFSGLSGNHKEEKSGAEVDVEGLVDELQFVRLMETARQSNLTKTQRIQHFIARAQAYESLLKFQKARDTFEELYQRHFSNLSPLDQINLLKNLGRLDHKMSKFDSSIRFYQQLLELLEKSNELNDLQISEVYSMLGSAHFFQGDYSAALKYYDDSLRKKYDHRESIEEEEIADLLVYKGLVMKHLQDYQSSLENYEQALKIINQNPEKNLKRISCIKKNIGTVYDHLQNNAQSIHFLEGALQDTIKAYGYESERVVNCLNKIGIVMVHSGPHNHEAAISEFEKGMKIMKKIYKMDTLNETHCKQFRFKDEPLGEADQPLYNRALSVNEDAYILYRQVYAYYHVGVGIILEIRGMIYHYLKDFRQSLKYYTEASNIYSIILKPQHEFVKRSTAFIQMSKNQQEFKNFPNLKHSEMLSVSKSA